MMDGSMTVPRCSSGGGSGMAEMVLEHCVCVVLCV